MKSEFESTTPAQPLQGMFMAVPPRYDLINHIITLGLDARWRRLAARTCLQGQLQSFLDLGCGTGDLALTVARLARQPIQVTGLDFSIPMLEQARQKADRSHLSECVKFVHGQADNLPFEDSCFDCVGISFAFRNLTYKNPLQMPHLAEVLRVLRKGGRYVIVETSQPVNAFIRMCFHLYIKAFVAPAGMLISGNQGAYRYLAGSMARYYSASEVEDMLRRAGFSEVRYRHLFFGAAAIHVATR